MEAFSRRCLTSHAWLVLEWWAFSTTLDILATERQACATASPSLSVSSVAMCSRDNEAGDFSVGLCLDWLLSSRDLWCFCHVLAYCIVTAQFTLHIWLNYSTKLKIFVNFIYSGLFIIVTVWLGQKPFPWPFGHLDSIPWPILTWIPLYGIALDLNFQIWSIMPSRHWSIATVLLCME